MYNYLLIISTTLHLVLPIYWFHFTAFKGKLIRPDSTLSACFWIWWFDELHCFKSMCVCACDKILNLWWTFWQITLFFPILNRICEHVTNIISNQMTSVFEANAESDSVRDREKVVGWISLKECWSNWNIARLEFSNERSSNVSNNILP